MFRFLLMKDLDSSNTFKQISFSKQNFWTKKPQKVKQSRWKLNSLTVISLLQGMVYPQVLWPQRLASNLRSSRLRSQVQWPRQQLQAASILYLGFRHHSPFWVLMAFHLCLIQRLPKVLCLQDFPQVSQVSYYSIINFLLANSLDFAIFQAWWTFIPLKHYWT